MAKDLTAKSTVTIDAPAAKVWEALTTPELIKQYFFGIDTETDWKVGSPIVHKGMWEGKPFEDKGKVLKFEPQKELVHTHWSSLSGLPDSPEYYQTVIYTLAERNGRTQVTIANDKNPTEESKQHSEQNWKGVLESLKSLLEK